MKTPSVYQVKVAPGAWRLLLAAAWIAFGCTAAVAQPGMASSDAIAPAATHPVYLKFSNAATGAALKPAEILIDGKPADFTIEAGSLVALDLSEGKHTVAIKAERFHPMEVEINVAPGATPVMAFELDSAIPVTEEPVADNTAVIEGHVTDADTGELLQQVRLTLPDSQISTTTDSTGHYEFQVKVPETEDSTKPVVTMEIRADDYVPVRMKNLALFAGERRSMPISLERQTSETADLDFREIDEAAAATSTRNFDWVFDVTVR